MGNPEIQPEIIWLIKQIRRVNEVLEPSVNNPLMNPDQACSNRRYSWHHTPKKSKAVANADYPYGFSDNITLFTGTANIAQYDGVTNCYMFVEISNSV